MDEAWIVDNPPSTRYPIYTRGNVGEVFPDPVAPLSWTLAGRPGSEPAWRDALVRFGAFEQSEFDPDELEILGVFYGYCYLNVSVSRIFGVRTPGLTPETIDYTLFGTQAEVQPYTPLPTDESPERTTAVGQTLGWVLSVDHLPDLDADRRAMAELRAARPDVGSMGERQLVDRVREHMERWFRHLFSQHLFITYASTVGTGIVSTVCQQIGEPGLAMPLLSGLGGVDSAAPSVAMWDLGRSIAASRSLTRLFDGGTDGLQDRLRASDDPDARRFEDAFAAFLVEFGSRGPNEWEMSCPTWETDPDMALVAIDRMRLLPDSAAPALHAAKLASDRQAAADKVRSALTGNAEALGQFEAGLHSASVFLPARERTKTTIVRLVQESRVMMRELGRRRVESGDFERPTDFAMLTSDELEDFLSNPEPFRGLIRSRHARWEQLRALVPPFVLNGELVPPSRWQASADRPSHPALAGEVLAGIPGCAGEATGRARVVLDPAHGGELHPGEVLVAPSTDPSWTPLFVPAAAVVVDVGAQLSHAVIVSRELGIPCVVSVSDATRRLRTGSLVRVDGTSGLVTVIDP
ncbi:MAG TPA: PEP-utilizing enzyme [Acidimicrobiales bacterium]|nr:PEP-utilizing enzyme [Acidimicrobiales bacterium]